MKDIYHLLITKYCTHKCPLCCNNFYDLDNLPVITVAQLKTADTVCITGGEPFSLVPSTLIGLCRHLREQYPNIRKLYIYSSCTDWNHYTHYNWQYLLENVDGLSVSPKCPKEWQNFKEFMTNPEKSCHIRAKQNRLYVFEDQWDSWEKVKLSHAFSLYGEWMVTGRKWDKEFKVPDNEHFVRLPILY